MLHEPKNALIRILPVVHVSFEWCLQVIAADIVLSRLTAHQMPPLNNNRGSSSSGSVDAMPSSSTTCASQDPPPGGVQSLTELEVKSGRRTEDGDRQTNERAQMSEYNEWAHAHRT